MAVTPVSTSLPDLILPPGATITVTLDDPLAKVTQLNVYGASPSPDQTEDAPPVPPLFAYAPDAV